MLYPLVKLALFTLPPEKAHDLAMTVAKLCPALGKLTGMEHDPRLAVKVGRLTWKFPIGLAAGLDKNAEGLEYFSAQGFGALETGTITLKGQLGNPAPRMFRYPEERSLRNAMGFPNHGLLEILPRVKSFNSSLPLGANIGKNKDSTAEESIEELNLLVDALDAEVDYFVINVSSPNTPGLRALQERSYLEGLFSHLHPTKDLYLKIAPDLEPEKIRELAELVCANKITGVIATNTTIMPDRGAGGVSGELLTKKAAAVRELILSLNLPIEVIGVGGISSAQDLFSFWAKGGKVAQVYTGYIYQGPELLRKIKASILQFLDEERIYALEDFFALPLEERARRLARVV
jgi:dihydroorotate dehydrogenase